MDDFAVVIPTHGRPDYAVQAVHSVLRQTYSAAEVVIVDDGGANPELAGRLRHPTVRVVAQESAGVAAARNRGIAETTARWVCFLDDDDLWHPDRLRRTADYLAAHPAARAVNAPMWYFAAQPCERAELVATDLDGCLAAAADTAPSFDTSYLDITGRSFELLLERNRGVISTATIDREILERAGGFPAGYTCAEDWLLFVNVARLTEWHVISERLSFVRIHDSNNTSARALTNGLMTLRAIAAMWDERSLPRPSHRALGEYGEDYRRVVQESVWNAFRRGRWDIARAAIGFGWRLLPDRGDLLYALTPPPVTWRLGRLLR